MAKGKVIRPAPEELLRGVAWVLGGEAYPDQASFEAALARYNREIMGGWTAPGVVLNRPRVRVCYTCWQGDDQVEPVVELESDDGASFTGVELLYKVHNAMAGSELYDHRFFEGFLLSSRTAADEAPLYFVSLGS